MRRTADQQAEAQESEQSVQKQQFIAEPVASEPAFGVELEYQAKQGGGHGHDRHKTVPYLTADEYAEGKHAQDGAVGI